MPCGGAMFGGGGCDMPIYYGGCIIIPWGGRAIGGPLIGAGPRMGIFGGAPMPTPLPGPAKPAGA